VFFFLPFAVNNDPGGNVAVSTQPTGSNSEMSQLEIQGTAVLLCESSQDNSAQPQANNFSSRTAHQSSVSRAIIVDDSPHDSLSSNASELSSLTTTPSPNVGTGSFASPLTSMSETLSSQLSAVKERSQHASAAENCGTEDVVEGGGSGTFVRVSSSGNQQPLVPSLDDIDIKVCEYPQKYRDDHFDVLLIYTADDVELAEGFRYILESCVVLEVRRVYIVTFFSICQSLQHQ
jgi:hypothetical protein